MNITIPAVSLKAGDWLVEESDDFTFMWTVAAVDHVGPWVHVKVVEQPFVRCIPDDESVAIHVS